MLPRVTTKKADGNTGVVTPGPEGNLCIIAPAQKGGSAPATYTRPENASADYGVGMLAECGAYVMDVCGNPVLLIRATASTPGAYGTVVHVGAGSSVVTSHAATVPLDDYEALITFIAGGTIGVAGITYTYSLDAGKTNSAVQALGTSMTITIPNSGVEFDLAAGTILAGQTEACPITGPRMSSADLVAALEVLRVCGAPWDGILVVGLDATSTDVSALDLWLLAREAEGRFRFFAVNTRKKATDGTETEAAFLTAMTTAAASMSSIRGCVGSDGGALVSLRTGIRQYRPCALGLAARAMAIDISVEPALVSDGEIQGFQIADDRDNPFHHDEALYPGIDDQRLTVFRSFDRKPGAYIDNSNLISPPGSDFVYLPHARVMNKGLEIAWDLLTEKLSLGVQKDASAHITESDAQKLESMVDRAVARALDKRVSGSAFTIARDDDLSSNGPAVLTCTLEISALVYVKGFALTAKFVRSITIPTG